MYNYLTYQKTLVKLLTLGLLFLISNRSLALTNTASSSGTWETISNWSLGHVPLSNEDVAIPATILVTINSSAVCANLSIVELGQITVNSGFSLTIGGNLLNSGTLTAGGNTTLAFNGAANSSIAGNGNFLVNYLVMNMSSKTTILDVQSPNFINGINAAAGYNFTFTSGTFKYNTVATLNDCHDLNSASSLTIPFNAIIESDKGIFNLCPNGANYAVILSGKLFINGGTVNVQGGQGYNAGFDFDYYVNGGTPQLYVTSGILSVGGGFHAYSGNDFIDFNMSGGEITVADKGMSVNYSFQLANVTGGSTIMTGGTIIIEDACNVNLPDIDMGGANVSPYSVTGGTVQFGNAQSQGGSTYFGIQPNGAHNYPNLDFEGGIAKNVSPWTGGDFSVISMYICPAMTFDISSYNPNVTFTGSNGTFALNNSGTFNMGTGTFTFKSSTVPQLVTGTSTITFGSNLVIDNPKGVTLQIPTTVTGTLYLTNGNLLIMYKSIIFQNGNLPIVRTNGTMSYNSTANLVFGTPGNTGGAPFSVPAGTFFNGLPLDTLSINRDNTLALNTSIVVNGTLILTKGTLDISGVTVTFQDGNNPISAESGSIITSPSTNIIFGTPGHTGGSASTIPTGAFAGTPSFNNFSIYRTNALTLGQNIIINGTFTMNSGRLNLAGNTLTLGTSVSSPGTLVHSGTAASGWIYGGNFTRYFNTNTVADRDITGLFPMGSSADFRPLYISHPNVALTSGGTISVTHTPKTTAVNVNFQDSTKTIVRRNDSYWTISATDGMAVAGTPFNISVEGTAFGLVNNVNDLRLSQIGSVVGKAGINGGTTLNPQINRNGLSLQNLANNFYPASVSWDSPLPIQLISFDAACNGDKVNLNWATASETNNDFFTVYKSKDAATWIELTTVASAGNSNEIKNYSFVDNDYDGNVTYYRLKQTDFNGSSTFFNSTSVDCSKTIVPSVTIYPNPFSVQATIAIDDASPTNIYEISIYNILGAELRHSIITNQLTTIETGDLPSGIYSYRVTSNDKVIQSGKLISQQ